MARPTRPGKRPKLNTGRGGPPTTAKAAVEGPVALDTLGPALDVDSVADAVLERIRIEFPALLPGERKKPAAKWYVIMWVTGSVIAGLLPIIFRAIHLANADKYIDGYVLLGSGELILIALTLLCAGAAEVSLALRRVGPEYDVYLALTLMGVVLLGVAAALYYADTTAQRMAAGAEEAASHPVTYVSVVTFLIAAALSSACVWFAAKAD